MTRVNGSRVTVGRPDATAAECARVCAPTLCLIRELRAYRALPEATGADRATLDSLVGRLRRQVGDHYRAHRVTAPELEP